jgi:catechol 2,3-dioxygenase-like lactoylglutathione lyase family enzyme
MATVANVQIGVPGGAAGKAKRDAVIAFYCGLLGMKAYEPFGNGYIKLTRADGRMPEFALEGDGGAGDARPQWPDPDHPQQVHLDVEVADLDRADEAAVTSGATRLQAGEVFRVFADPVGHPFCLYASDVAVPRLARIVFDCPSPRALAGFYEEILGLHRVLDTPERVEIADRDPDAVHLAFQYALGVPPRWMDPRHPAQIHLDLIHEDVDADRALLQRLGAMRLRDMSMHTVWADPAGHPFCG